MKKISLIFLGVFLTQNCLGGDLWGKFNVIFTKQQNIDFVNKELRSKRLPFTHSQDLVTELEKELIILDNARSGAIDISRIRVIRILDKIKEICNQHIFTRRFDIESVWIEDVHDIYTECCKSMVQEIEPLIAQIHDY